MIIAPVTTEELNAYQGQLAAMDDSDFAAERAQVLQQLAAARAAVARLTERPTPVTVPAGVDLSDGDALADFLEKSRTVGNAEAIAAGGQWVRRLEKMASKVQSEQTSRARRRAGEAMRADVLDHAELLAEFADFVRGHHALARQVGGQPLLAGGIIGDIDQLLKRVNV